MKSKKKSVKKIFKFIIIGIYSTQKRGYIKTLSNYCCIIWWMRQNLLIDIDNKIPIEKINISLIIILIDQLNNH